MLKQSILILRVLHRTRGDSKLPTTLKEKKKSSKRGRLEEGGRHKEKGKVQAEKVGFK
jgi:hypothetical protein